MEATVKLIPLLDTNKISLGERVLFGPQHLYLGR